MPVEVPYFHEEREKSGSATASVGGTEDETRSSKRQSVGSASPLKELMRKNGISQDRNGKISFDSEYSLIMTRVIPKCERARQRILKSLLSLSL